MSVAWRCALCVALCSAAGCESAIELRSKRDGQAETSVEDAPAPQDVAVDSAREDVWSESDAASDAEPPSDGASDAGAGCASNLDCPAGQSCIGGMCSAMCVPSVEICNGADDDCDGMIDESDAIGAALCLAGAACVAGRCTPTGGCAAGQIACGGACVDVQTDPSHCGACGVRCAAGARCVAGSCVP